MITSVVLSLSECALRTVADSVLAPVGLDGAGAGVGMAMSWLRTHLADPSGKLEAALQSAMDQSWRALELALAGDSFWDRCKGALASGENKGFAEQLRQYLDYAKRQGQSDTELARDALRELRAARAARHFTAAARELPSLEKSVDFRRFDQPGEAATADAKSVARIAAGLRGLDYARLAELLELRPAQGRPLMIIAVQYFFRRRLESDAELCRGLTLAKLDKLEAGQEQALAALESVLRQGERLEALLSDVKSTVEQTHGAVLDLQGQLDGLPDQVRSIGAAVQKLLQDRQMNRREVRPLDSLSIRNDNERQLVKQLIGRYRALPESERRQTPALLNAVGKLEVVTGDFEAARKDFAAVAALVDDHKAAAEAHHNAYRAALERRDWDGAYKEFIQAVKLDGKRFAPFPVGKYHPLRILGAGGFGVAFLCKHKLMQADAVVKTLMLDDLGRDTAQVFTEAQVLRQLEHPAIIRISECGFADSVKNERPYIIMDYFEGGTLEEYVNKHGAISAAEWLPIARQMAAGLQAAHQKSILHRDVKPANVLVRRDVIAGHKDPVWRVKLIDFGLAMRQKVTAKSTNANTSVQSKTLAGASIAGTLDYAAPEQMGKRNDDVGPYSDVYGWARTCCYALFRTTQPLRSHWTKIPEGLADLIERCLAEDPKQRPRDFGEVLAVLAKLATPAASAPAAPAVAAVVEKPPETAFAFDDPRPTVKTEPSKPKPRPTAKSKGKALALIGGAVGLLLVAVAMAVIVGVIVFRAKTPAGTLVVEIDEPGAEIFVDGKKYSIARKGDKDAIDIEVEEGSRELKVTKRGFQTFTKRFSVKSGGRETMRVRLEPVQVAVGPPVTKTPAKLPKDPDPKPTTPNTPSTFLTSKPPANWGSFVGRKGAMRAALLKEGNGDARTEDAVAQGFAWLARQQQPDGSWTMNPGDVQRIAGTGLALLPLLGDGQTHMEGKYAVPIAKGLSWLTSKQNPDGSFPDKSMYVLAIVTQVLCEAYGMSGDPELRGPAQKAVAYLSACQHSAGGWRYVPNEAGDTSVTGWQVQALKAAKHAGLNLPPSAFSKAALFFESTRVPSGGYSYLPPGGGTAPVATSAIGLLGRMVCGSPPNDDDFANDLDVIARTAPPAAGANIYYYFWASQLMRHVGGKHWAAWEPALRDMLLSSQAGSGEPDAALRGSWPANKDEFGAKIGRLMVTSLSLLSLQSYYRNVPYSSKVALDTPPTEKPWINLFNGKDLTGWRGIQGGDPALWKVVPGAFIEIGTKSGDIGTVQEFKDHQIQLEFMIVPAVGNSPRNKGNSGVFVQGRYEIQILDSFGKNPPTVHDCGALYEVAAPLVNACTAPGTWQTFDITFRHPKVMDGQITRKPHVTVIHNGKKVLDNVVIERVSGLALDQAMAAAGPVRLQDHGDRVRFRNIRVRELSPEE